MATFKLVLDKRSTNRESTHHLAVRVCFKKEILYLRLGIKLTVKEFEKTFLKVSYRKDTDEVRKKYDKYIDRAKKIFPLVVPFDASKFRELYFNKQYDPDAGLNNLDNFDGSLKILYDKYLEEDLKTGRLSVGTREAYKYNLRALLKFKSDLKYYEVTPDFLNKFEAWFVAKGNSLASIGSILRSLRRIINYFTQENVIPKTFEYPFRKYTIPEYFPPKLVITNKEIQSIIDLDDFDDPWEKYARDVWVLLYRMNGINFVDLLKMRWDNIQGNHFVFIRHKTRKTRRSNIRPIKIGISEKIKGSLELVGDKSSPFVLGLLPEGYNEIYLANKSKKYKGIINRHLKKVSKKLNLSVSLDISLARDSYANTLKRANMTTLQIGEQLGHADPKTTLKYLDMFDQETLDKVNEVVL